MGRCARTVILKPPQRRSRKPGERAGMSWKNYYLPRAYPRYAAGRADEMDIQLLRDNHISRRNHGVIDFQPKKKETVLLPGDSNGLVYHNEAAVYTPTVLNSYDVIEMGESKFAFVPFCGENFMWEDKGTKSTSPEN